ncbi:MAG: phage tail protein [Acidobacteria bacterium]|nr:MAG: phage tail protein [Acidobacteriota bacterium]
MSDPYIGEIRMFGGNFAPQGWAMCQGQLMAISQNDTLFNLIGTTYGGDGQSTFGLPNLQGRVPLHQGQGPGITQNYTIGELAGVESVTLTAQQTPTHSHPMLATTNAASQTGPSNNILATSNTSRIYIGDVPGANLAANAIQPVGGSQPHENMMSFLVITFIISLFGIFPTQS